VEIQFKELVQEICSEHHWNILAMAVMPDHCHLFLNCLPTDSPSGIMAKVKASRILGQEFPILLICLVYGHVPSL
jgi:putative transposase